MNTNVLTIQNLLPLNPVVAPAVQKPLINQKNISFESSLNQIQSKSENTQQTTADNNTTQSTQNNPDTEPQQTDTPQTQKQETNPETAQQPTENTKKTDKNNQNNNSAENTTTTTEDQTGTSEEQIQPVNLNIALASLIETTPEKPVLQTNATSVPAELAATNGETKNPVQVTVAPAAQKTIIESVITTPNNQTNQTSSNENNAAQILDNQLTPTKNPDTQPAEPQTNQPQQTTTEQPTNSQTADILSQYTIANVAAEQKAAQPQTANTQQPAEQTVPENNQPVQKDTPSQTIPDTAQKHTNQTNDANPEQILSNDKNQSSSQNSQTQSQNNQSSKDNSSTNTQQLLIEANARFQNTEQLQSAEQISKNNSADNTVQPLSRQVQESMQTSLQNGVRQITIQLNPPSLGRVSINFQETAGEITGRLIVSKAETKLEIEQSLPQIIQDLSDSGINIKRVEVVLTSNSDQYSLKEQSLQENSSQQNNFNNQQSGFANDANQSWTNTSRYEYIYDTSGDNIYDPQESYLTETSVNILV